MSSSAMINNQFKTLMKMLQFLTVRKNRKWLDKREKRVVVRRRVVKKLVKIYLIN